MSSQFVTPSNDCHIQIKSEPLEDEYQRVNNLSMAGPGPTHSPAQITAMLKYGRVESMRNRAYEKPHSCCEVCQGEFSDQDVLLQHKLLHFNTSHVCYICDCYFMNTSTLIMHIATNHRNLNPAMTGRNDPDRSFLCSICLQRFSSNKTLTRHQETHKQQDETTFSCRICGLEFIGYRALVPHLNAARHKEMKIKIQGIFVCVDCRSVFPSRDSYAMHMMMRAQSETCSSHFLITPTTSHQSQNSYDYAQSVTTSCLSPRVPNSNSTRSDSVPLNLCTGQERISPNVNSAKYQMLTCCKCGELMPDEEALALHLMVHVREASDQPYYSRCKHRPHPSEQRAVSAQYAKELPTKRPDSAPASDNPLARKDAPGTTWICHWCNTNFKSCDMLAMHMMEHHMQSQAADKVNNNRRSFSDINEAQGKPSDGISAKPNEAQLRDKTSEVPPEKAPHKGTQIPRKNLRAGETCFSERSSPVTTKRAADDAETSEPKRCKSVGSSLTRCIYCGKQFIGEDEKRRHIVDEHGVSWDQPHCLVCNSVFLQQHALMEHLQSAEHLQLEKAKKAACHVCRFVASSDAQIAAHEHLHGIRRELQFETTPKIEQLISELSPSVESEMESSSQTKGTGGETPVNKTTDGRAVDCDVNKDAERRVPIATDDESTGKENKQPANNNNNNNNNGSSDSNDKSRGTTVPDTASTTTRRSKRKSKVTAKFTPGISSPPRSISENDAWADATDGGSPPDIYGVQTARQAQLTPVDQDVITVPVESSFNTLISSSGGCSSWPRLDGAKTKARAGMTSDNYQQPSTTTGCEAIDPVNNNNDDSNVELIDYILSNTDKLSMCKYCKVIYTDQTIYYLHMGLHNLNNPWQCNLCGKVSRNVHDFTCHVIHY